MPLGLIGYGLMALAIIGALGGIVYKIDSGGYARAEAKCAAAAEAQRKREADLSAFAAKALADERAKRKTVIQTRTVYVDKEVEKPVYRNICFADTGVSCLNAAIDGKDAAGCKPDAALPSTKPPG